MAAKFATRPISSRPTSSIAMRARLRSCTGSPRAPPISRPSCAPFISASIPASSARPDTRCWRIWRTWRRAARSRPMGRPRSTAFIGWLVVSLLRLLWLLRLLRRLLRLEIVNRVLDRLRQRAHARRVGAEVVPPITRGRANIDAGAVGVRADAEDDVIAEPHDRRAEHDF